MALAKSHMPRPLVFIKRLKSISLLLVGKIQKITFLDVKSGAFYI